jgi:hypothetical protein
VHTLLDLRETWENIMKEERKDYEPLFSILDGLRPDTERRYSIEREGTQGSNCDVGEDIGHLGTGVKIPPEMSHNVLPSTKGVRTIRGMHLKSEIAQRSLSDLGRGVYAWRKPSAHKH